MTEAAQLELWCGIDGDGVPDIRTVAISPGNAALAIRAVRGDAALAAFRVVRITIQTSGAMYPARDALDALIAAGT